MSNELIERIDEYLKNYLGADLARQILKDCKAEINRLLLANEILLGENISLDHTCAMLASDNCLTEAISEPVAWIYSVGDRKEVLFREFPQDELVDGCFVTPLYTAPPSIDALIADIESIVKCAETATDVDTGDTIYIGEAYPADDVKAVLDKWRTK